MIAGTLLGWRALPGIDLGDAKRGWIMLGGSSVALTRTQATEAITLAFHLGDCPQDQGLPSAPVAWCDVICLARRIPDSEREAA